MRPRSPLLPIFLIVLVDVLGFTIVIPLLALYAEKFGASPLVATLIVTSYAACALIATPFLGRLSDQFGRRRLLLISQAGTCAGFIVLGFSTTLWMVFLGRILDGFTAGNLAIAQAYISDHTKPEHRAKAFGVIGVAFGIGFMFGPALGGWLGDYGMHLPFLVAAGLSALSMLCTYTLLPRNEQPRGQGGGPGGRRPGAFDLAVYAKFFRRPQLRALYLQFFLFAFAFSVFTSGFALFAERRYLTLEWSAAAGHDVLVPWGVREVGYLFAFLGLLGILWQGGLIGRMVRAFGEARLILAGFVAAAIGYVALGLVPGDRVLPLAAVALIASFGVSVLRPVLTSSITRTVGPEDQGVVIGISGSLSSLAMIVAPPTGGYLIDHGWLLAWAIVPCAVSVVGLLVAVATRSHVPAPADPDADPDPTA